MDGRREGRKEGGKVKERISWFGIGPKFPLSLSLSLSFLPRRVVDALSLVCCSVGSI